MVAVSVLNRGHCKELILAVPTMPLAFTTHTQPSKCVSTFHPCNTRIPHSNRFLSDSPFAQKLFSAMESPPLESHDDFPSPPNTESHLAFSDKIIRYLANHIPRNTDQANETALCSLSRFTVQKDGLFVRYFTTYPTMRNHISVYRERMANLEVDKTKKVLFAGVNGMVPPSG